MSRPMRPLFVLSRLCYAPLVLASTTLMVASAAQAQTTADDSVRVAPKVTVPVRTLGRVVASDSTLLMDVSAVRHLPRGGVIVNDTRKRQLVVFDSALATARVISDTTSNSPNPYGLRVTGGSLIPYRGDSTLFMDLESAAFLVIDENGEFARVMAPVRANDMYYMGSFFGAAAFDAEGRLWYRSQRRNNTPFPPMGSAESRSIIVQPDSAPIMRMDFDKRTVDTVGMIKIPVQKEQQISSPNMMMRMPLVNPLPQTDEWTLMPDGRIAIVRGHDYHVDWMTPDGKITSAPRLPFEWRRISREEKVAMVDSVKRQEDERQAKLPPPPPAPPGSFVAPRYRIEPVSADDLPDFYPAVRQGQVRSDPSGRIWILPATARTNADGLVYDVVNGEGRLEERVQLPKGRTLIGFGPEGMLYLNHVRGAGKSTLERAWVAR